MSFPSVSIRIELNSNNMNSNTADANLAAPTWNAHVPGGCTDLTPAYEIPPQETCENCIIKMHSDFARNTFDFCRLTVTKKKYKIKYYRMKT